MPSTASTEGVLRLLVSCNGDEQPSLPVISCSIRLALNAVPWARLVIEDGDMPNKCSPLSDGELFKPGTEVKINAGYANQDTEVFSGIVVRHGYKITGNNYSRLIVECRDKACKMTLGRRNANYVDKKDSDIIQTLISDAGLSATVSSTAITHKELVQYYCSDWDFMLARAELLGLVVNVSGGAVSVKAPAVDAAPVLTLTWGDNLFELHADIDARSQWTAVQAQGWDPAQQALVQGASAEPLTLNSQGDLDSATLAAVASPATVLLQSPASSDSALLDQWAKAVQLKAGLARVRGRMSFQGTAAALPGSLITLAGVGNRFNGDVYVSAVQHEMVDGNWISEAEFGLDPNWLVERPDVVAPLASGQLPGVSGLQIGVVMKLDGDPAGESRIQIKLPSLSNATEGVWARLLQLYASNSFGALFLPEVSDEVLVGYLNGDPSCPVVLGSLYSSKQVSPYALEAANNTKAIVTRCKHKIEFNEEDKIITVTTPANNKLVLDDKDKSILVQDQNGNSIKLSESGIALDSPKDIKLTAKGGITLDAVNAISISSKADVKAAGLNIACEAQVGFTGKGSATAELSASGQTTVKGAMVMIN
ncbi:type VI secretion system tip protein VgrG [Paucibacter sp. APW11]|uniref:Type VI secretion system tip protein VgrG n=1 Tax=Roseateles aquae TaxID=3077235 RepID=A0ABU3P6M6_9BURK|nr:type VI secretion system tip protein VgrG [Paucibacter sp. APW11]MDT8998203.1 type VI secretion system tip protein VgrG [Paucibacter sp. APW11]